MTDDNEVDDEVVLPTGFLTEEWSRPYRMRVRPDGTVECKALPDREPVNRVMLGVVVAVLMLAAALLVVVLIIIYLLDSIL